MSKGGNMPSRYRGWVKGALASGVALALVAGHAGAQVLEEITVTAQKREQSIQDVGIAITAFTGEQLDALGIVESTEIAALTPGVAISGSSAGQTREFTIRGVTQNDFSDIAENPNATYVDEGYIAFRQGVVFAQFDMERVEILKGPQGTLFGRNATGGLVHFITRKPTDTFEGFGDVTYGEENQVRFEGAVSGPLTPAVSGRVSGMYNRHDDILKNVYPDQAPTNPAEPFGGPAWFGSPSGASDLWDDDQWAVRGQLLWEINEDAEVLVSGFGGRQQPASGPYQGVGTTPIVDSQGRHVNTIFAKDDPNGCEAISAETGACVPLALVDGEFFGPPNPVFGAEDALRPVQGGDLFGYIDADGEEFDTSTDHVTSDYNRYATYGATGKLTWDLGHDMVLTAVSHYMHFEKRQSLDVDSSPIAQIIVMNDQDAENFAQEVRINGTLDRARWVAGFYYLWIDAGYNQGLANSPGGPFTTTLFPMIAAGFDPVVAATLLPGQPGALPPLEASGFSKLETNSYSVFGQIDFDLTEQLTFIAGLRTIFENKDFDYDQNFYVNTDDAVIETDIFIIPGYGPFSEKTHDTLWTGKLEMDYRPTEDWLIYASLNRGVKAGGFNAPLNDGSPRLSDEDFGYDEEVLTAYEVGFKSTLFEGSTRFNASFFYYDYDDYQAFLFKLSSGAVFNNDAKYKGIEFEVQTNIIENLDFMFNASFLDAEVTGLAVAPGIFKDVQPTFTPSVHLAGLARYEWPQQIFGGTVALQLDSNYASSRYHNIRNYEAQQMEAYVIGNARLSWYSADERWELQGFVKNLNDARYKFTGFDLPTLCGCNEEAYGYPRWWGVRLRYNFGG
jgi:iron complex outermembrane receptor protein